MAREKMETVYCCHRRWRELNIYFASSGKGAKMVEIRLSGPQENCVEYFSGVFPGCSLIESGSMNALLIGAVRAALENHPVTEPIPLDVEATPFQMAAWRTIARIPYGTTKTYSEVANMIGKPLAARAVGQAMGKNPLPLFFP